MTRRIHLGAGRLIVTKPGFDAAPGVVEAGKVFDSDWGFTGTRILTGYFVDPAPAYADKADETQQEAGAVIPIPQYFAYRSLMLLQAIRGTNVVRQPINGKWSDVSRSGMVRPDFGIFYVDGANLRYTRPKLAGDPPRWRRLTFDVHYQVYAL